MRDLVITLGAVDDGLVEGPEQYTISLSSPGSTTGANVAGTGSVTTTIIDADTAIWSITGSNNVNEGTNANYTVHLDGTLQANGTATLHLALADTSTTSGDHANFVTAVNGSNRRAHRPELRCRHRHADLHRHRAARCPTW